MAEQTDIVDATVVMERIGAHVRHAKPQLLDKAASDVGVLHRYLDIERVARPLGVYYEIRDMHQGRLRRPTRHNRITRRAHTVVDPRCGHILAILPGSLGPADGKAANARAAALSRVTKLPVQVRPARPSDEVTPDEVQQLCMRCVHRKVKATRVR